MTPSLPLPLPTRRREGGFSFIEILVVMGIISVLVSMVVFIVPTIQEKTKQTKSTREEKPVSPAETPPEQHKNPAEPRYVIDDVRSLLARVSANGGNARELLKSMGAERLSQLPEAKYGSIIGLASDWLEGNLGEYREGAE